MVRLLPPWAGAGDAELDRDSAVQRGLDRVEGDGLRGQTGLSLDPRQPPSVHGQVFQRGDY